MPCMCGDTYCHSCGPAQGNARCYACGAWEADGGCSNPDACEKELKRMDEDMAAQFEDDRKYEQEFKKLRKEKYL